MSFSWWCHDKAGRDLFDLHEINGQALNLAPNCPDDTDAVYRLNDIRHAWASVQYKEQLQDAAQDAMRIVKRMLAEILQGLQPHHCETCTCVMIKPEGWNVEDIKRFLDIPIDQVWRCGGGW